MVAVVKDPRNNITDNPENIFGIYPIGYQSDYLPYHQGGTISVSGSASGIGWTEEAESDYVWIPPQDADSQKSIRFINFTGALNQVVDNIAQTTVDLMNTRSSGTYYSNILGAQRVQIAALFEFILLTSKHLTLDIVPLLHEAIVSGLQSTLVGVESIGWNLLDLPKSIKKEIDLELKKGHHDMAVKLASKGLQLFPEDTDLKKIADILAPPKVIQKNVPPSKGLQESMKWLKENRSKYQGQWIALQDGILLGHAESREQLADVLDNVDVSETLITKLP